MEGPTIKLGGERHSVTILPPMLVLQPVACVEPGEPGACWMIGINQIETQTWLEWQLPA